MERDNLLQPTRLGTAPRKANTPNCNFGTEKLWQQQEEAVLAHLACRHAVALQHGQQLSARDGLCDDEAVLGQLRGAGTSYTTFSNSQASIQCRLHS
jgi:hypothetical protein